MSLNEVKRVVIAGGGTAGWVAAAALSIKLGELLDITLVESDEIGTVGVGEAAIPPMRVFHKLLNIDEQEFMRTTEAVFKLGILFDDWGEIGDSYIHSFGKTGKETWLAEFHHFWLRAKELGVGAEFGDYCYELQAAKMGKFATSPESKINFSYHLDATRYAQYLRSKSEMHGLKRIEGKIAEVVQHKDSGSIDALRLESGQLIAGDLFIDCTGFRGLLIEQTLQTGYDDWSHWLPCDSAVAVQTESTEPPVPYVRCTARESGWQWKIPLQHRVGNGIVYCSRYMSDDAAREQLLTNIDGETITNPRLIKFKPGHRRKMWNKNCVALGLASGFLEPLESTSIHLVMMGVTRLMQLFPFAGISPSVIDRYNQLSKTELEGIRDFIILHYCATEREDTPFWRHCKTMEIPETLDRRINLFRESAHVYQADSDLFRIDSWVQVMLGQRIKPQNYHHVARMMSVEHLEKFMTGFEQAIRQSVEKLPDHIDFVRQYCNAGSL